jgi:hemerythrin
MRVVLPNQILTGISGIDDQHRSLIRWARTVNSIDPGGPNRRAVIRATQFLIAYARYHFDSEEYAMVASGYEGINQHRREHAMMRRQLNSLSRSIKADGKDFASTVKPLQSLIQGWIQNHISGSDMAFASHCEQEPETRFMRLPSPRELRDSGFKVSDIEQVETVHNAGEITHEELKARLIIRD